MDDFDLYDEFGNYIGEPEHQETQPELDPQNEPEIDQSRDVSQHSNQIVLHEDKKYYPSAQEIYGNGVEALVQEEDTMPLSEPIIAPLKTTKTHLKQQTKEDAFLTDLLQFPDFCRNVAIVGHLHHGKTALVDALLKSDDRFTSTHTIERQRGISIKAMPISMVLPSFKKSYLINFIDTPGHVDFIDEIAAAIRICDGAVLVVDVIEGVMANTRKIIQLLMREDMPFTLLINKMDRLILELKLAPSDAYYKIRHTLEEVNAVISILGPGKRRISPELGNVCFASTSMGWFFTLESFSRMYASTFQAAFDTEAFAKRLWGDVFYNPETNKFVKQKSGDLFPRTFCHFILDPIYKLYAQVVGEEEDVLKPFLESLGIYLKRAELAMDIEPLLKLVAEIFFTDFKGFVEMLVKQLPSPVENAARLTQLIYTGDMADEYAVGMSKCDRDAPLMIQIVKLYNADNVEKFSSFGRIMSGSVTVGQKVRVLGLGYTPDDEEDSRIQEVTGLSVFQSRYKIPISKARAGSLILIDGIESSILKTATVVAPESEQCFIFKPLRFPTQAVLKIALEPVSPTDLPKMLDGLRSVGKSYCILESRVEESGEHVLLATGEMYLDCVLHDLRNLYSEIDIKVSDPVVKFCETVTESSSLKCFASTPNKKNKITVIAEPLEDGIAQDIELQRVDASWAPRKVGEFFQEKYEWDILAGRNVWAFGPDDNGPNILINDTLPAETDKNLLAAVRDTIKQGFQWGTREAIRNVKFRILDASIAQEPIFRGGGQIIPTSRRVCYSSFLMSTPRLMEPVYFVEIQCPADCVPVVYDVLAKRRGHVTQDIPKPGSPLYILKAFIPVIDAAGFETDLRTHTQGQAFCQCLFDHWQLVPGDPMDKSLVLKPLEPSTALFLARDFMIKTRRRKGLSEDVNVVKYFDQELLQELAKLDEKLF